MSGTTGPRRLVLLLVDGLRADVCEEAMGYLVAAVEAGEAQRMRHRCALPSLSRPLYATLLSGQVPLQHGVLSNDHAEVALASSVLDDLREDGRRSVVTAYHWVRELLTGEAFDPWLHRDAACPAQGVTGARWYWQDPYPDDHLLADAESLRRQHDPDFMLVHPMGLDHAGHVHGGESTGYRAAARRLDTWLTRALPRWHAAGFDVLLTSDHGMNADGWHGGDLPSEREVPLWWWPCRAADAAVSLPTDPCGIRGFVRGWLAEELPA